MPALFGVLTRAVQPDNRLLLKQSTRRYEIYSITWFIA
jgi:hypothetical protein